MVGPDWMEGAPRPISKILVANRGEIACRIFRSCAELGLGSVSIYSESDRGSLHQQTANESVFLPGVTLSETYLNIEAILAAAEETEPMRFIQAMVSCRRDALSQMLSRQQASFGLALLHMQSMRWVTKLVHGEPCLRPVSQSSQVKNYR